MSARRGLDGPSGTWAAAALLLGAWLLRLWNLGGRSLWTDEGSAWTAATSPLPELLRLCAQKDASPPLFYLLTSVAMRFGDSEAHLRFVSALASAGIVWIAYRLARLAAGRREALLAAALTGLSPFQVLYGQEARTYALAGFLTVAAFYLFLRAALFGRRRAWVPFALVTTLGLYTQSITLLGVGAQAAVVVLFPGARRRVLPWLASLGAAAVLFTPWLLVTLGQMSRLGSSHWYMEYPGTDDVVRMLRTLFVSPVALVTAPEGARWQGLDAVLPRAVAHVALLALPGVPLVAALRAALEPGTRGTMARVSWLALALPLLAVYVVSLRSPLWLPRYFVFLTPFIAVLTARGLATLRPAAAARAWTALLLLALAYACLRTDLDVTKEPWRDVVADIAARSAGARSAVLVPFDLDPFRFYNVRLDDPLDAFEVSHPEVPFASDYSARQLDEMERRTLERTRGHEEVWVIVRSPNSEVRREVVRRAEAAAAAGRVEVERRRWDSTGGPLRVSRFRRVPTGG